MKNKTLAESRKITRTIELNILDVTVVDLNDKTVKDIEVAIPAINYRTNTALEKAIVNAVSAQGNYKYVTHTVKASLFRTYAMPETQYLANATLVAEGSALDKMNKVETITAEADEQ